MLIYFSCTEPVIDDPFTPLFEAEMQALDDLRDALVQADLANAAVVARLTAATSPELYLTMNRVPLVVALDPTDPRGYSLTPYPVPAVVPVPPAG